jgi:choline dehydrogenase-like flavoprotein
MSSTFDFIIVGGGTAGVVIASRLRQSLPSASIALIEAGPNAVDHPLVNDVSSPNLWFAMMPLGLVVDYSTIPQPHLDNREIMNVAGRFLSGSSGVNVGHWMRPSAADCELIAQKAGNEAFRFENMVKYFRRVENHFDTTADKEYYGFGGPVGTVGGRKYPLREKIQESARRLGHEVNPHASRGEQLGLVDLVQCYKPTSDSTSTRQHSARVYDLSGVDVRCDAPVARILFDDSKRAIGVELVSGEKLLARNEVVVSCGTQKTPQLLMLSGVGPADELAKFDVPVIVDAPAVGQNLMDHSAMLQVFKLKDEAKGYAQPFEGTNRTEYGLGLAADFNLFAHIPAEELKPHFIDDGRDADLDTYAAEKRCHFMIVPMYDTVFAPPPIFPTVSNDGKHICLISLHMMPLSRGTVSLRSSNIMDHPVCNPRFLSTNTDRFVMRRALRENLALVSTTPMAEEVEGEVAPLGFQALTVESSDEEIDARIRATSITISHPMGTCALGKVLGGDFKVKGVEGLRVCDASVFPVPVAAMPSCTIYAMAELCAEVIAGRYK